jgi:polyhydroxyalkanoate synthesis regulator phasin
MVDVEILQKRLLYQFLTDENLKEKLSNDSYEEFDLVEDGKLTEEQAKRLTRHMLYDGFISELDDNQHQIDRIVIEWLIYNLKKYT